MSTHASSSAFPRKALKPGSRFGFRAEFEVYMIPYYNRITTVTKKTYEARGESTKSPGVRGQRGGTE